MKGKIDKKCIGVLIVFIFLQGCAGGGKTYLLNVDYNPVGISFFPGVAGKTVTVALYNFQDARRDRLYIGQRVYPDREVDFYQLDSGNVEQLVTNSAAKVLEKAGFQVRRVSRYLDQGKEDFKDIQGDAAVGGKIDSFWVGVKKSGRITWDTDAQLRFQVHWVWPKSRTWINVVIEGSAQDVDRPFYQAEYAQAKINEVLKDAMDKLLKDEKPLRELLLTK
jgi:hypothetical protein